MYAEAVASYQDGALADRPAATWHAVGSGHAWYLATCLDRQGLDNLAGVLVAEAGMGPDLAALAGVEVARRWSDAAPPAGQEPTSWVFVLNHTEDTATIGAELAPLAGTELLTGETVIGTLVVPAGGVRVAQATDGSVTA